MLLACLLFVLSWILKLQGSEESGQDIVCVFSKLAQASQRWWSSLRLAHLVTKRLYLGTVVWRLTIRIISGSGSGRGSVLLRNSASSDRVLVLYFRASQQALCLLSCFPTGLTEYRLCFILSSGADRIFVSGTFR